MSDKDKKKKTIQEQLDDVEKICDDVIAKKNSIMDGAKEVAAGLRDGLGLPPYDKEVIVAMIIHGYLRGYQAATEDKNG